MADLMSSAVALHRAGNLPAAEKLYREILGSDPRHAPALHLLGVLACQTGRADAGIDSIRRALGIRPDFAEAHYDLGVIFMSQGKAAEAAACHREALRLKPGYPEAWNGLGIALKEQKDLRQAMECYRRALQLQPRLAWAHNNIGNVLMEQDRLKEALPSFREALRLNPAFFEAHNNLGNCLQRLGRLREALASYDDAIRVQADYGEAHWNKSVALLAIGEFALGWREYEWRGRRKNVKERSFRQPVWDGSVSPLRTILVHAEQGLGDTLQFVRYLPRVKERVGRVVFECPAALLALLADFPGVDQMVGAGSPLPAFDVQAPLMSLPGIFGTTVDSIPAEVPYLAAQPSSAEDWRRTFGDVPGLKVGIAWQGNPRHLMDRHRSIPLQCFAALARVPGVRLYSLQRGHGAEQLREPANQFGVSDLGPRLENFTDTAAVMKNLDLVITADTAVAHLAGALNVPVWIAIGSVPDWRWLLERTDSPWYPSARLFRQVRSGDWTDVFSRMAEELARLASTGTRTVAD